MPFVSLSVVGVGEVRAGLQRMQRRLADAFEAGRFIVASEMMTRIVPGVPVETGNLVESRAVTRTPDVQIVFGSPHAVYSHALGKKRRWLQVPFSRMSSSVPAMTAAATARALAAGWTLASAPAQHPETPSAVQPTRRRRPQRAPRGRR